MSEENKIITAHNQLVALSKGEEGQAISIGHLPEGVGSKAGLIGISNSNVVYGKPKYVLPKDRSSSEISTSLIPSPDQLDISEDQITFGEQVIDTPNVRTKSTLRGNFYVVYVESAEDPDYESSYADDSKELLDITSITTKKSSVLDFYNKCTAQDICPNGQIHKGNDRHRLESVSLYKTIDLLCEGTIEGLADQTGTTINLTNDQYLNENLFKGIYYNDVPVKNTFANTKNYSRAYAEIRYGGPDQPSLSMTGESIYGIQQQKALSFKVSGQTFTAGMTLPGLNRTNFNAFMDFPDVLEEDTTKKFPTGLGIHTEDYSFYTAQQKYKEHYFINGSNSNLPSIYLSRTANQIGRDSLSNLAINNIETAIKQNPVKFQHAITNDSVTDVEISFSVQGLNFRDIMEADEPPSNNTMIFVGKIHNVGDDKLLQDGGSAFYFFIPITGVATSQYIRSYQLKLPPAPVGVDRQVTIINASMEPTPEELASGYLTRSGGVAHITELVDAHLTYPSSAIVANLIDARAFSRVPKRTYDVKLGKIFLPNNYDPVSRQYSGNWTGEFSSVKRWSNNPAWVFYDMVTNKRYGLGKYGFSSDQIDKWGLYSIAKYCDELVETGYQAAEEPFDFTISEDDIIAYIDNSKLKYDITEIESMFKAGSKIAIYKPVNSNGENLNIGFHKRIGETSYDLNTNKLAVTLHDIINVEQSFRLYPELLKAYFQEKVKPGSENLTELSFLSSHLIEENKKDPEERDAFSKSFHAASPLGLGIVSGKIALEANGARSVLEPRFSTNVYFDKEQEAYNLLNDLAAIFRGMIYWNNGFVFASSDQTKDAIMMFNNTSVKDGVFTYSGSSKTTRFTSVLVRYNDQYDSFKPKVVYVEDSTSLRKYGYLQKKIVGLGITSRSQAQRLGRWFLYTNQLETDLVQFVAGPEATILRPGDVVKIQDNLKTSKRYGGRVKSVAAGNLELTLDKGVYEDVVGQKITLITPRQQKNIRNLSQAAVDQTLDGDSVGVPQQDIDDTRAPQITQFTITGVSGSDSDEGGAQNNVITVTDNAENDFGSVQAGTIWSLANTNTDFDIQPIEYRVVSISEDSAGQYQVTCLTYERSKFSAVDQNKDLVVTQQSKPILNVITSADRPDSLNLSPDDGNDVVITEEDVLISESSTFSLRNVTLSFAEDSQEVLTENTAKDKLQRIVIDWGAPARTQFAGSVDIAGWKLQVSVGGFTKTAILTGRDTTAASVLISKQLHENSIELDIQPVNSDGLLPQSDVTFNVN